MGYPALTAALPFPSRVLYKPMSFLKTLREAVRGSHHQDYTEGPIGRSLILLAVPMVLETVLESVFAVVDVFFVARLGADAIATVGLTEAMETLVYAASLGLGIGVTAMVARRIGEKDPDGAAETAVQAIILGVLVAIGIAAVGVTWAPELLGLMGGNATVQREGAAFTRVIMGGNVAVLLLFLINAIFRGAGDAAIAMRSLWIANAFNIVLGPCLVFGFGPFPRLGLVGAAIGTTTGRSIGVLYQLSQLRRRDGRILIRRAHLKLDPAVMWRLVRLSGTGIVQMLIGMTSWIGLIRVLAGFGSQVLAGYTVAIRIVVFALLPAWGLSNAAATMVGQALGAKKPERGERATWLAAGYSSLLLGAVGLAFVVFAGPIIRVFTDDPAVVPVGVACLRTVSGGFLFYGSGMVLSNAFNGAGDTWTPTWLNLACFWLWEIPLAWVLARTLGWGPQGVFTAITIAFSTFAVASALLFRRGRWKTRVV